MERVLLKEEVPRGGATSGVGIDRRKRHRKGNKKEGRTKKPKGGEVEEEEEKVPGDGSTSGVGINRRKRHRQGNKKEERTKKPKGVEVGDEEVNPKGDEAVKPRGDELVKPKGGEAMEEMTRKKGGKKKLVTLRSDPTVREALVDEIMSFIVCQPRSTFSELSFINVALYPELSRAAAILEERRLFYADLFRQYRLKGYADVQYEYVQSEVPDDEDNNELTHELVEIDEEELTHELVPIC